MLTLITHANGFGLTGWLSDLVVIAPFLITLSVLIALDWNKPDGKRMTERARLRAELDRVNTAKNAQGRTLP